MADFSVKLEAELSQDSPLFISDDEAHVKRSPSPFVTNSPERELSPSPAPSYSGKASNHAIPTWQRCGNLDLLKQIEIKEKAAGNGLVALRQMEAALQHHAGEVWSSSKWLERIEMIRASKKDCRVLIGFLGVTGAGKSTLINSILGLEDLLPADDEKACTAVICEISWNPRDDPKAEFVAIIDRISKEEWESELQELFQDIADKISNKDGDGEEPDLERDERIKSAFGKVRCVYPSIKSIEVLQRFTVATLMGHCNVRDILGESKIIHSGNLQDFGDAIKPYIDSSDSKEDGGTYSFAQWPLVKLVRLQVKAEVLETGIVLVDLPGSMDTNVARGALAATYTKNLTVSCVVSPTSRAASDKPAQELLGSITKRYLQLEDHFTSDHLCFIVTKTDSSLNVSRYIRTHPDVHKGLGEVYEKEARCQDTIAYMQNINANTKQRLEENGELLRKLNDEKKKLETTLRLSKSKRKRGGESPTSLAPGAEYNANKKAHISLNKQIQETRDAMVVDESRLGKSCQKLIELNHRVWTLNSKKMQACIQSRNAVSTEALRDDFESVRKQMGEKKALKPLQVFCISALAHFEFRKSDNQFEGFFHSRDTGIPALRKWLIDSTLGNRSTNAESFLADIESLETTLWLWAADTTVEFKLPAAKKYEIENSFDEQVDALCKKLQELNTRICEQIDKTFETSLFKHMPLTEKKAIENGEEKVRGWAQRPMVWSTHRACNRNNGDWKSHKGTLHHWSEDLAGLYLNDHMIKQWRKTVHRTLPEHHLRYNKSVGSILSAFVNDVVATATAICPQVSEPLGLWKQSVLKGAKPLKDNAEEIFQNKIKNTARDAHQIIAPKIKEFWLPTYEKCGAEHGKGHFNRNIETHVDFIQKNGRPMYKKCSGAIRGVFRKLGTSLPVEFSKSTDTATANIKEEFSMMMDNHTMKDTTSTGDQGETCAFKVQLRDALNLIFENLRKAWAEEVEEVVEEEEEEPEEEDVDISEFKAEEGSQEDEFVLSDFSDDEEDVKDDAKEDGDYVPGI